LVVLGLGFGAQVGFGKNKDLTLTPSPVYCFEYSARVMNLINYPHWLIL